MSENAAENSNKLHNFTCPLCQTPASDEHLQTADGRTSFLCPQCRLIWVDPTTFPARDEQRAHYQTHENSIDDTGYVAFLARALEPVKSLLKPGVKCLDFGCGPGPTLSTLVERLGATCADYDPIFFDRPLDPPYDVIFSTECVEHFHFPAKEFARLKSLLAPAGELVVMTETWTDLNRFRTWYYTRDPTHVAFFHEETIKHIARAFEFTFLPTGDPRVFLFRNQPSANSDSLSRTVPS